MTKFEDQLFGQLMAEHGHRLQAVQRPGRPAAGSGGRYGWPPARPAPRPRSPRR